MSDPKEQTSNLADRPSAAWSDKWRDESQDGDAWRLYKVWTRADVAATFGDAAARPSSVTPLGVVLWQMALTVVCALCWIALSASERSLSAGVSAMIGGAISFVPGAVFALRLSAAGARAKVGAVFVGVGLKMVLTVIILMLAVTSYPAMNWAALLVTYVLVVKIYWVALMFR